MNGLRLIRKQCNFSMSQLAECIGVTSDDQKATIENTQDNKD